MQESLREIITRRRKSLFRSKNVRATLLCLWDWELCPCVQINIHRNTPPLLMKFGELQKMGETREGSEKRGTVPSLAIVRSLCIGNNLLTTVCSKERLKSTGVGPGC
jgi:hypothetical protein